MTQTKLPDFDPGLRSSIELLYGSEPSRPGELRGETVRGRTRYSPEDAIRAATSQLLPRLSNELCAFARRRPACGYAHAATSPTCRDAGCQGWMDEIVAWHSDRFGARHFDLTLGAVLWISTGRELSLEVSNGRWRDTFAPSTVALDIAVNRAWVTAQIGVHATASKADLHDLIDRMWPQVERLREAARSRSETVRPSHARTGRVDRPARATYWRLRQFQGLSLVAILEEWEGLTRVWAKLGGEGRVNRRQAEYPAWVEWRHRGRTARVERFEEVGTIQRAIAKLRKLTA